MSIYYTKFFYTNFFAFIIKVLLYQFFVFLHQLFYSNFFSEKSFSKFQNLMEKIFSVKHFWCKKSKIFGVKNAKQKIGIKVSG